MRWRRNSAAAEEWLRWFWLWDLYFSAGYFTVTGLLLTSTNATPAVKASVIAALTALVVWYAVFGRPFIVETVRGPHRGRIFSAGVLLLAGVGIGIEPSSGLVLSLAIPMLFMSLQLKEAIPAVMVAILLPPLSGLVHDGPRTPFAVLGPGVLFGMAFALALGVWIHRIVSQSEDRAALIKELEASRDEIGRLSREAGVAAERSRLAAEIHDTLAQGFTSLLTLVQAAESELDGDRAKARRHLELAARTARENLGEARALVAGLMPTAMGTGTLDEAIQRQVDRLTEETGVRVSYEVDGELNLPTAVEVVFLRAVQESLTNVRKHSGAHAVRIRLRANGSSVCLTVTDDGGGFDPSRIADGFGLRGMRARATQLGGSLAVHSGRTGTTVELEVPQ